MSPYLSHLLVWFLPIIAIQWAVGWKIFRANLRAIFLPTLIAGTYYSLSDVVAISEGIWFFGDNQILGVYVGPVPIEEILFFFLTALLVAQSFVLFLPARLRHGGGEKPT
ncbi:MAG: lycopene cyclase domain-containing protein [Verrucomicrobiales bacterium]